MMCAAGLRHRTIVALKLALAVACLTIARPLGAQEALHLEASCAFYGADLEERIFVFPGGGDLGDRLPAAFRSELDLMRRDGVMVRPANVPIAAAGLGAGRWLLYEQYAFAPSGSGPGWRPLAILAHQIGHHRLRHALSTDPAERRGIELAADSFAATLLHASGAPRTVAEVFGAAPTEKLASLYPTPAARMSSVLRVFGRLADEEEQLSHGDAWTRSNEDDVPAFPWPTPEPSARTEIPFRYLTPGSGVKRLVDVARTLEAALLEAGYVDRAYYAVPGGFAVVTQVERIGDDGTPADGSGRWIQGIVPPNQFTLASYLRALFRKPEGRYRLLAFVVTSAPVRHASEPAEYEVARDWLWRGNSSLPASIGIQEVGPQFRATALIYEFHQEGVGGAAALATPSALDGREHLERSALWSVLTR